VILVIISKKDPPLDNYVILLLEFLLDVLPEGSSQKVCLVEGVAPVDPVLYPLVLLLADCGGDRVLFPLGHSEYIWRLYICYFPKELSYIQS
jgi:hypothetical protein